MILGCCILIFGAFLYNWIIIFIISIMEHKMYEIPGSYGDKIIKISHFYGENNPNIIINIHGTYGSMNGWNNKYRVFAHQLQSHNIANVVLYESSRKSILPDPNETDTYKQKQAHFIGKTFFDELEDARRVLQNTLNQSQALFGIEKNKCKIILNGNSLWGILAFYLAHEFSQVKAIVSVWTGLRLEIKNVPVLDTFPNIHELKEKLQSFTGKYVCYYGTDDDIFTKESFFQLLDTVGNKKIDKSIIEMPGVNHSFWKVNWEVSHEPYHEVFLWHMSLLKNI